MYFVLFGSLVFVSILVAAAVVNSIGDFITNLPALRANLPTIIEPWQARVDGSGVIGVDLLAQTTFLLDNISNYAVQLAAPLQQIAVASLGAIGNLLLVVVLSLYMVADRERLVAFGFWLVPSGYKAEAEILEEAVSRSFGGFIRGQVITGLAFGAICLVTSVIFGLDYLPVTTFTAGLLMIIPFFGPFLAWVPPVLAAILLKPDAVLGTLDHHGRIGWIVVMNVLQPRIMADATADPPDRRPGLRARRNQDRGHPGRHLRHPDRGRALRADPPRARTERRQGAGCDPGRNASSVARAADPRPPRARPADRPRRGFGSDSHRQRPPTAGSGPERVDLRRLAQRGRGGPFPGAASGTRPVRWSWPAGARQRLRRSAARRRPRRRRVRRADAPARRHAG